MAERALRAGMRDLAGTKWSVPPEGPLAQHADRIAVTMAPDLQELGGAFPADAYAATCFQNPAWLASWNRHALGARGTPVDVVAYRGGEAVLQLPLVLAKRWGVRCLEWQATELNDYCGPVAAKELLGQLSEADVRTLFRQVASVLGGVDFVRLEKQLERYGGVRNPFAGSGSVPHHVKSHEVNWTGSWEAHYAANRGAKTRRRLKEKFQALSKRGQVVIRLAANEAEAERLVSLAMDMKAAQLARLGFWNSLERPPARAHCVDYFGKHCQGQSWVAALELDGQPLAIAFGFRDAQSWLLFQIAMDDGPHSQNSPGTHLLMFLLRTCGDSGATSFDFSLGDERYKDDWCNATRQLANNVFPLSARGALPAAFYRLVYRMRLAVVASPKLHARARFAKRWILTALARAGGGS